MLGVALAGCVDTRAELDEFVDRDEAARGDAGTGGPDSGGECGPTTAEALAGDYLFALAPQVARTLPIVSIMTVTAEPAGDQLEVTLSLVPLRASDRKTPIPGSETSATFTAGVGPFTADFGTIAVPGAANPISGTDLQVVLAISGELCGADAQSGTVDFLCGTVAGNVVTPNLDLNDSAWTARRITDPGTLPPIAVNCAGEAPTPLP